MHKNNPELYAFANESIYYAYGILCKNMRIENGLIFLFYLRPVEQISTEKNQLCKFPSTS